ncbi:Ferric/cupric reductase transmembrane component 2 [Penicillium rolfsii]|nr:Ferric/cupric reductase transmembrane component 2 [Penicillium rolfsii]
MGWPYHFVDLTPDEKSHRRDLLSQYAFISQVSVLFPILGYGIYRFCAWIFIRKRAFDVAYSALRQLPGGTESTLEPKGVSSNVIAQRWRTLRWWLNGEIAPNWGLRGRWIAAIVWISWLLVLCFVQTGHDYLHVTKRFGSVAAAQLPLLFLLSMRTRYSPIAIIFGSSHEQLIHWHQICARVIMTMFLLHGTWYINYFVQNGILADRLQHVHSITGLISLFCMAIIAGTSLQKVRQWSYRVFIYCHITLGLAIWPILLLHAKPLRLYAAEALAIFISDRILRYMDTVTEPAILEQVPHTELLKIRFPMPSTKLARFQVKPGQHVYLSMPSKSTCTGTKILLSNPFTVSEVTGSEIALVIRARRGPTTRTLRTHADRFKTHPLISIEGPYGGFLPVAELASSVDRILLVAGGIGATFILPIYRALQEQLELEAGGSDRLNLTWALRSAAEAGWATDSEKQTIAQSSNVHVYLTRHRLRGNALESALNDQGLEMDSLRQSDELVGGVKPLAGRPDLKDIVDETFRYHSDERVAVIFCGPQGMGRELRSHLGKWVARGREVIWHQESFGW